MARKTDLRIIFLLIGCVLLMGAILAACATSTPSPTATLVPTPAPPTVTPVPPTDTPVPTATPIPTPTITPNPHVKGADCASCHTGEHKRWSLTLHAADAAAVLTNEEHNKAELLTDECITCHSPFQAASFKVGDFVQPVDQKGPWKVVDANTAKWEGIKCEVCHDPTSSAPFKLAFYDSATQRYVAVKDSTELCEKCHQAGTDDSRDLKGSVHQGIECATCHFQKGTEMSLDPRQSCQSCHPKVNPKHPDVMTLDTTFKDPNSANNIHFITCAVCHPKGIPTPKP